MSVSFECKEGVNDVIYFIDNCCVEFITDENGLYDEEKSVKFLVGDMVYYLDYDDKKLGCNSYITMIKFRDRLGKIYSVNECFLVTEDVWNGLKEYFDNN